MTTTTTIKSFPAGRLADARDALAKAQARLVRAAAKSGQTAPVAPVLTVTRTYLVTRCFNPACTEFGCTVEGGDLHYCSSCLSRVSAREVCELELTFARPALAGWELTAVVEPLDGGNLVKRVPGSVNELDLTPFFTGSVVCDHCKTTRDRKETFLVTSTEDNDAYPVGCVRQVGRNCLADFLGGQSPAALLSSIGFPALVTGIADEDGGAFGGHSKPVYSPAVVLVQTAAVVRLDGFVSKKTAGENEGTTSTASAVSYLLNPPFGGGKVLDDWRKESVRCAVTAADSEKGLAALAWAAALSGTSDYERNLSLLAKQTSVDGSKLGFLCSAVAGYERFLGATAKKATPTGPSAYVGTVGEKLIVTLTVDAVFDAETQYGVLHINKFRDADGNCLVWKTTSARFEPGKKVTLKGTVKKQEEFRSEKQTELTRCSEVAEGTVLKVSKPRVKKAKTAPVPFTNEFYTIDENGAAVRKA